MDVNAYVFVCPRELPRDYFFTLNINLLSCSYLVHVLFIILIEYMLKLCLFILKPPLEQRL